MSRLLRFLLAPALITLALTTATTVFAEKPRDLPLEPQVVPIEARRIPHFQPGDPARRRFGALEWVGGLTLSSRFAGFGGFSGLAYLDGQGRRALVISDAGVWLELNLATEGEAPVGVSNARMAPMRDERGRSVAGTPQGDAEAIAIRGEDIIVTFEGSNRARSYPLGPDPLTATAQGFALPANVAGLRRSRGLESFALFPTGTRHAGAFLAVGESPAQGEAHHRAWIVGGAGAGQFTIVHRDDFHVTDAAILANGDALLLERRVRLPFGVWARLRRVAAGDLVPGATVDGAIVFEADLGQAIDNMEGMALHRGQDGATYVTLISDDNYSLLQRTVLLRFKLVE